MADLLLAMELVKSRIPDKQHGKIHQRRQVLKLFQLTLIAGAIICLKDARMEMNATTRMYAAWTGAAGNTQHTSMAKPQVAHPAPGEGEVIPKTFPDVKGTPIQESPEWENISSVPVPNITKSGMEIKKFSNQPTGLVS